MSIPGIEPLVTMADRAVAHGEIEKVVDELRTGLCELIRAGSVKLPEEFHQTCGITTRGASCIATTCRAIPWWR